MVNLKRVLAFSRTQAQVYFPDYEWPLQVKRAVVRWINADEFVIKFLEMLPAQKERLRVLLAEKKFKLG